MTAIMNPNVSAAEYHAATTLGICTKSALDQIARSPLHYRSWLTAERKETPAMRFGSLVHSYVLETAKCLARVAIAPDFGDLRTKAGKAARDEWRLANEGREAVNADDWDSCRRIGDAVHKHPIAGRLIAQAQTEVSVFWEDRETGLDCKARVDGWVAPLRIALDLKTTEDASPTEFAKSVANYRYMAQAAHYSDGLAEVTGEPIKAFLFIAVEKTGPFAVATYTLDSIALDRGRELCQRDMATMRRCLDSGEWPAYGESTKELSLPAWSLR